MVPGRLLADVQKVEIVLEHPHAASPMLVVGEKDARRLAAAFSTVALVCCG